MQSCLKYIPKRIKFINSLHYKCFWKQLSSTTNIFSNRLETNWSFVRVTPWNTFESGRRGKYTPSLSSQIFIRYINAGDNQIKDEHPDVTDTTDDKVPELLQFDDYRRAFRPKQTLEIFRALAILQLTSFDFIVNNANKLIIFGRRIMGKRLFDYILKRSVYEQFVAGGNLQEIRKCVTRLQAVGIRAMLAVPIEEDLKDGDNIGSTDLDVNNKNLQIISGCFNLSSLLQHRCPMIQIKMTAIASAELLWKVSQICPCPVKSSHIIDDVVVGMKTGKRVKLAGLSCEEEQEFNEIIKRMVTLGQTAKEKGIMTMVDAEYTYFNGAIKLFILSLMLVYNDNQALICLTYQSYLKATFECLKQDVELINSRNRCFGLKLVRGAYMFKERELAKLNGYADPVHDNFEDTSNMYITSVDYLLDLVAKKSKCAIMIASHNEKTISYVIKRANELNIHPDSGQLFFGQLFGMCDHVSFTLGQAGYPVYKSIPYGSVGDTIPYLIRRAQENRSVLPGARRERELLKKALRDRLKFQK